MWRFRLQAIWVLFAQKSQEGVRVISDEEGGCSVPVWITSTGLLFDRSAQMLQEGNDWCSLWCGKSFLVPTWIATWKLLLNCCARKLKEERVRAIVGKSFSVPVWFSTSGLVPYCFAQILQEKKGVVRTLMGQDDSWFSGVLWWRSFHFCLNKCYKRKKLEGKRGRGKKNFF